MKTNRLIVLLLLLMNYIPGNSQVAKNSELFLKLKQQDSIFFERSFNLCDIPYLEQAIDPELRFYHDKGGIQDRNLFLENVKKNICGDPLKKPIRKVDEQSLEVFGMYNNNELYGAVQTGTHYFYIREKGKEDVRVGVAKFIHLYLLKEGRWILKEAISFDHQ